MPSCLLTLVLGAGLASTAFNTWQVAELRGWLDDTDPVYACPGYDSCWEALTYAEVDLGEVGR